MSAKEGKKEDTLSQSGARMPFYALPFAIFRFSLYSLRGRIGQALPVTLALLLIVGVAQAIGALDDVSSTLTHQQIAASWRAPADLLVRPQSAVSQPERTAGWISSTSLLDSYGGISTQQVTAISTLSQVAQILPFATVGWQRVDIVTPVVLQQPGLYRITAQWTGAQQWAGDAVDYVEVSNLNSLVNEEPMLDPIVQHLVLPQNAPSVVYAMPVPALQLLLGVASAQEDTLRQLLLQDNSSSSLAHLTIHVDKLNGQFTILSSCITQATSLNCWQHVTAQTGRASYLPQEVQLSRYSQATYSATPQQLAAGELSLNITGQDARGYLYRSLLPQHVILPDSGATRTNMKTGQQAVVVPLSGPEYMPVLPAALQFVSLTQACLVNGAQCYSGLYIRLRGVDAYSSKSLALLQATAAAITARTGLHVDILDGSSTRVVTLETGDTRTAQPLTWRVVGAAVQITQGVDALQKTLFLLCSLICLLATGASGILIGISRKSEARLLEQLGWSRLLRTWAYIFDALLLALPGCLLDSLMIVLAGRFWPGNVPAVISWALLGGGVIMYSASLVGLTSGVPTLQTVRERVRAVQAPPFITTAASTPKSLNHMQSRRGGGAWEGWWRRLRRPLPSATAFHTRITAPLVCAIAIIATIFLIAIEYFMVSGLNRELVITVLGDQVRVALEGPQFLLTLFVLLTALLTVGLCTSLLLRGRRQELTLLARLGWERQHVLLRLLRESWWMASLSGTGGAVLALLVIMITGSLPPLLVAVTALVGGPLLGMALASLIVYVLAQQELKSVYLKRA